MKWPFVTRKRFDKVVEAIGKAVVEVANANSRADAAEKQLRYCNERIRRKEGIIAELTQKERYRT